MNESHQYSRDEIRDMFLDQIWLYIDYWSREPNKTKQETLEGLAHSILVLLDGETADLPAFCVLPLSALSDQEYLRKNGENWFPALMVKEDYDIAGELHSMLFSRRKVEPQRKEWETAHRFRVQRSALALSHFGFTTAEAIRVIDWAVKRAAESPQMAVDLIHDIFNDLAAGLTTRERVLREMEHIVVITTRQLKEIDFAMKYVSEYNHGTPSHNHLVLVAALAEGMGFVRNGNGNLEIPQRVRVEDGPQTGAQTVR